MGCQHELLVYRGPGGSAGRGFTHSNSSDEADEQDEEELHGLFFFFWDVPPAFI